MRVTIIGLGLMGGSLALRLKELTFCKQIIGVDNKPDNSKAALELGLVKEVKSLEKSIAVTDVFIVATPVKASIEIINYLLGHINDEQVVVDLGSTKLKLCQQFKSHPKRKRYVAAHPIAGTENSGPQSAISNLYEGKKVVICEKNLSDDNALSIAIKILMEVGMETVFMSAEAHDKHLAYISHLSHVSSFALGLTVLDLEKDEKNIFNLAGSGFASTARLAKSSPEMWKSIFSQNKEHILPALDAYITHLSAFRDDIANNDEKKLAEKMNNANNIRKIIQ